MLSANGCVVFRRRSSALFSEKSSMVSQVLRIRRIQTYEQSAEFEASTLD